MRQSLDDWLTYVSALHPIAWDLTLDRVKTVATRLNVLRPAPTVILVAGTNGKGSCCEAISWLAGDSGRRVGLSTSPHLQQFNERIRIDGERVSDQAIVAAFESIDRAREEITLSYFEFSCLAALLIFKGAELDVAVLEIGLGGRLDAMNIVDPDLAVILPIALDHQDYLGDDREAIGREKAGILRSDRPLILADPDPPASIIAEAQRLSAPVFKINTDFHWREEGVQWTDISGKVRQVEQGHWPLKLPQTSLAAAVQAMSLLAGVESDAISGLKDLTLLGRMTNLRVGEVTVYVDVAHNPHAAEHLANRLRETGTRSFRAVVGMYAAKDAEGVLGALAPLVSDWFLAAVDESRALAPKQLRLALPDSAQETAKICPGISAALAKALTNCPQSEAIIVFGSFPVVGEALEYLARQDQTGS